VVVGADLVPNLLEDFERFLADHPHPANEDEDRFSKEVEQRHRQDIIGGWKELGMQQNDLGYLTDSDGIYSRGYFLALQCCDSIQKLVTPVAAADPATGEKASVLVFESSPGCFTKDRSWLKSAVGR
jgi:hypothetical protein